MSRVVFYFSKGCICDRFGSDVKMLYVTLFILSFNVSSFRLKRTMAFRPIRQETLFTRRIRTTASSVSTRTRLTVSVTTTESASCVESWVSYVCMCSS